MDNVQERFFGYTRECIIRRQRIVAAQVRAVVDHTDDQYRVAVIAVLQNQSLPKAPLMDAIAFELPRLEDTPIDDYFMEGTSVDSTQLDRVVSNLQEEGQVCCDPIPFEGLNIEVFRLKEEVQDE